MDQKITERPEINEQSVTVMCEIFLKDPAPQKKQQHEIRVPGTLQQKKPRQNPVIYHKFSEM